MGIIVDSLTTSSSSIPEKMVELSVEDCMRMYLTDRERYENYRYANGINPHFVKKAEPEVKAPSLRSVDEIMDLMPQDIILTNGVESVREIVKIVLSNVSV